MFMNMYRTEVMTSLLGFSCPVRTDQGPLHFTTGRSVQLSTILAFLGSI